MFSPSYELVVFMSWTGKSMNNLLSYCGLVDPKISASDKDLPVKVGKSQNQFLEFSILPNNERKTWKNYPKSSRDIFFSCFVHFLEELIIPNKCFHTFSSLSFIVNWQCSAKRLAAAWALLFMAGFWYIILVKNEISDRLLHFCVA